MSRDAGAVPPLFTLKDICSILGRRNILRRNYAYSGEMWVGPHPHRLQLSVISTINGSNIWESAFKIFAPFHLIIVQSFDMPYIWKGAHSSIARYLAVPHVLFFEYILLFCFHKNALGLLVNLIYSLEGTFGSDIFIKYYIALSHFNHRYWDTPLVAVATLHII